MAKKLPADLSVFTDSPLRPTELPQPLFNAPVTAAASETALAPAPDLQPPAHEAPRQLRPQPKAPPAVAPVELLKRTVYVTRDQDLGIEEAIYERRRAGERVSFADVHREILDDWLAKRSRQKKAAGQ